ncbi:MAG: AraC family transcriptional regulator [bacterium]|nr:AraC family transcriptional regulator [bacterium]
MNKLKIITVIEKNKSDDQFTVRGLAGEVGISYSYLYEVVHKNYDMSPRQLIETVRLEEAIRLIAGGMKMMDIVKKLGYDNIRTFRVALYKRLRMNYTSCRSVLEKESREEVEKEVQRCISCLWASSDN